MKSEVIRAVFLDELDRNKRLLSRYTAELETLPKGSVFKRKIGKQEYYYLNFRDGKKVISKFLGNVLNYEITELQKELSRRAELSALIKKLKIEQKELLYHIKKSEYHLVKLKEIYSKLTPKQTKIVNQVCDENDIKLIDN